MSYKRRTGYSVGPGLLCAPLTREHVVDCIGQKGVRNGGGSSMDSQGVRVISKGSGIFEDRVKADIETPSIFNKTDKRKVEKVSLPKFSWQK
jgi:hypothetical protein